MHRARVTCGWWPDVRSDSPGPRAARRCRHLDSRTRRVGSLMSAYSLQGVSLSSSERRSLQLRQQARAAVDRSVLQQTVAQALQALEKHKEEGGKASNPWITVTNEKGTPWVGDAFGWS